MWEESECRLLRSPATRRSPLSGYHHKTDLSPLTIRRSSAKRYPALSPEVRGRLSSKDRIRGDAWPDIQERRTNREWRTANSFREADIAEILQSPGQHPARQDPPPVADLACNQIADPSGVFLIQLANGLTDVFGVLFLPEVLEEPSIDGRPDHHALLVTEEPLDRVRFVEMRRLISSANEVLAWGVGEALRLYHCGQHSILAGNRHGQPDLAQALQLRGIK